MEVSEVRGYVKVGSAADDRKIMIVLIIVFGFTILTNIEDCQMESGEIVDIYRFRKLIKIIKIRWRKLRSNYRCLTIYLSLFFYLSKFKQQKNLHYLIEQFLSQYDFSINVVLESISLSMTDDHLWIQIFMRIYLLL